MTNKYQALLNSYYQQNGIHSQNFKCKYKNTCRSAAFNGKMTETKMSMVGSQYGANYPRIVVVSLYPPSGEDSDGTTKMWTFKTPDQRTTEYVSSTHEGDNYDIDRPNDHWAMTQILVKDLLELFGYKARPFVAKGSEKYVGRPIENVTAFFAHVNVAKCSMNNPKQKHASQRVLRLCSNSFLLDELAILEPDILISQGAKTNKNLGQFLIGRAVTSRDLPMVNKVRIGQSECLYIPMVHPAHNIGRIIRCWTDYLELIKSYQT